MRYKSKAHEKYANTAVWPILAFLLLLVAVAWIESSESKAKYKHCMFEAFPDISEAQQKACAKASGYTPANLFNEGGIK